MDWLATISILCLAVTATLCTVGVFARFDDTLTQRIGLSLVAIWCILRVEEKLSSQYTEPVHIVLHLGLMVYAVGTFFKVRKNSGTRMAERRSVRREFSVHDNM